MKRSLVLLALLPACSFYVNGELLAARDETLDGKRDEGEGDEGEGEGEGSGEGEGEAGGEGEGEGEGEPGGEGEGEAACEANERLVVVTTDPNDPLRIFKLVPGGLLPLVPTDFAPGDGALVDENGSPASSIEAAAFGGDRIYVLDGERLYALDAATLRQVDVRTGQLSLRLDNFFGGTGLAVTAGQVLASGNTWVAVDRDGAPGSLPVRIGTASSFHGTVAFVADGVTYGAANTERGYAIAATASATGVPASTGGADDDGRFNNVGPQNTKRAIAYDDATGTLLLGDQGKVILPKVASGFALPAATTDYELPDASVVSAAAARGGVGYLVDGGGDFYAIDLTTVPPTTLRAATAGTSFVKAVLAGCQRVIVVSRDFGTNVLSFDGETLASYGGGASISGIVDAFLVDKDALGLAGDD